MSKLNKSQELNIHFEPGWHAPSVDWGTAILTKAIDGDPNAFLWHNAVARRIARYNPSALAIDGLEAAFVGPGMTPENKLKTWVYLPARPSRLTDTGKLHVLAGDSMLRGDVFLFADIVRSIGGIAAVSTASLAVATEMVSYTRNYEHLSRRQFLKCLAGGAAIAAASGGVYSYAGLGSSAGPQAAAESLVKNVPIPSDWLISNAKVVRGRNALLAQKLHELPEWVELTSPDVGLILGDAHTFDADVIDIQDRRTRAIRVLADIAHTILTTEGTAAPTGYSMREYVIGSLADMTILDVKEIEDNEFLIDPHKTADEAIQVVAAGQSQTVLNILENWEPAEAA